MSRCMVANQREVAFPYASTQMHKVCRMQESLTGWNAICCRMKLGTAVCSRHGKCWHGLPIASWLNIAH
eukprot:485195-Pleurochrysis_carterae.AAC.1